MSNPVFKTTGGSGGGSPKSGPGAVEFKEGETIFREGDLGTEMFIILDGKVEIYNELTDETQMLAILEKGDFFGEMSILDDLPRAATVRALTDVKLLPINGSTFDQMLRANPEIAVRMMRKLSRRLRETDDLLKNMLGTGGGTRVRTPGEMPALAQQAPGEGPEKLIHIGSGMEFPLSRSSETTIGRKDPVTGIFPDIDLSPLDVQRSISRRHAKIYRRGAKFFLAEEIGTMNATFLRGARLETGVPAEIRPGDELRFGMVVMRFEVP